MKSKNKIYDIKNLSKKEITYFLSVRKPLEVDDLQPVKAVSTYNINSEDNFFVGISYILHTINAQGNRINFHTTTKIINNDGKLIKIFDHLDYEDNHPIVSQDGKYYALSYGGAMDRNENMLFNQGYRIYDIATEQLLYKEEEGAYEEELLLNLTTNNVLIRQKAVGVNQVESKIIDIELGYLTTFTHPRKEYLLLNDISKMVATLREDVKNKKTLNSKFKTEKTNYYQNK
jgi:hypothetical protein